MSSPGQFLCVQRAGVTPIVATVILMMLVITMAAGTITFVQTQQEAATDPLTTALDGDLLVEDVTCQGRQISVLFNNQGTRPLTSATADIRVFSGGNINYTLSPLETEVTGSFMLGGSRGYFNVTTDGVFNSGELYRIQMDFGVGNTIDRLCRAGADWWDLNYAYRVPVTIENTDNASGTFVATVDVPFDGLPGRFRDDCADIRVVEDGQVVPYEINDDADASSAGDDCSGSRFVDFRTTIDGSTTAYDTYIYYDNINAGHAEQLISDSADGDIVTRLGDPEQR